jgi:hypothetical protein
MNQGIMKTTLAKTAMVLALLMAAAMAQADDATMKKEMLGYWASGRHGYLYKDDGISYMLGGTTTNKWDVRDGMYYEDGTAYKIIAFTKTKFTFQGRNGIYTLKRLTKEDAEKTYGKLGE